MCGVAGFFRRAAGGDAVRAIAGMLRAQTHRGPDGAGLWVNRAVPRPAAFAATPAQLQISEDQGADCALGHNWLAIQDQSRSAGQPMQRGSLTIVFNGEIYNFVELRQALQSLGEEFVTNGDTEVLLAMWTRYGAACLPRLRGMFAFLLYDSADGALWAVRDPFGIKPLYFADNNHGTFFSSEIRAMHAANVVPRRIREGAALASIAGAAHRFGEFDTLYDGVRELPGGHWMRLGPSGRQSQRWYTLPDVTGDLSSDEDCQVLMDGIQESVRVHLRSSRRIATCLSGGLDSSVLVTLVNRQGADAATDCTAFTINTAATSHSEIDLAKQVTGRTSLPHRIFNHQSEISARDAMEMAVAYEVPNHVIGPINQFLLLREIAAQDFTVVLSGEGGDELVSGYTWWFPALLAEIRRRGRTDAARQIELARQQHLAFDAATTNSFDEIFYNPKAWIRAFSGDGVFGVQADALAELPEFRYFIEHDGTWAGFRRRAYETDSIYYLLRQADRLGMWFGLECRVPYTDAQLVETAASLSPELLIRDGYLKYPTRRMNSGIPESVRWCTRKLGFWKTEEARFPWMRELAKPLVLQSDLIRRLLPDLERSWDTARFDQQWRVLQIALLEHCATRSDLSGALSTASIAAAVR